VSPRYAPSLFGAGAIEAIPDEAVLAEAERDRGDGIAGLPNVVRDAAGQPCGGRFGWKGDIASVDQFVAEAMRNELGLTNLVVVTVALRKFSL
jgi:CxxC motif-containing protein (DUF1111 family)